MKYEIVRETEKAVAIKNKLFEEARETFRYDVKELDSRQIKELSCGWPLIWLPKSKIKIENNFIIDIEDWLAKEKGLLTDRIIKAAQERFRNGVERYEKILNFAKNNGLKVRNKMKLKTILKIIRDAGLNFEF